MIWVIWPEKSSLISQVPANPFLLSSSPITLSGWNLRLRLAWPLQCPSLCLNLGVSWQWEMVGAGGFSWIKSHFTCSVPYPCEGGVFFIPILQIRKPGLGRGSVGATSVTVDLFFSLSFTPPQTHCLLSVPHYIPDVCPPWTLCSLVPPTHQALPSGFCRALSLALSRFSAQTSPPERGLP